MLNKILAGAILASLSVAASAGKTSSAIIDQMMIDESYGGVIFIRAMGEAESQPECSGSNGQWDYVLPLKSELQKDTMTSFLLSAYMAGKRVQLIGNGTCDSFSSIETLRRVEFESQ